MEKTTALADTKPQIAQTAIRCAKAAILLSSLKHSLNPCPNCQILGKEENEEVEMLKMELVREKVKNRKMKVCSVMDLFLQFLQLLLLWTLCFMIAAEFHY